MTSSEAPTHIRKKSFEIDRSNTEVTANVGNPCSIRFALLLSYHRAFAYASTGYNERVKELGSAPPLSELPAVLLVDKTGVGAAVLDAFEHSSFPSYAMASQ